ncbi:MAG: substrate-binding domain-containing protein [Gemmatimonadota bacterium]|nr:substrate-binding domain-containing protein [Gemmatimonadota bacterium]
MTLLALFLGATLAAAATPRELRVCADPNNLPFSNRAGRGFENRIAELVGRELGATVRYTWWPQRRGFVRQTLNAGQCDLVIGVPVGYGLVRTTRPYYRSSYAAVTRRSDQLDVRSLDDPRLRHLRIGVHVIGSHYQNVPPAHALAARRIVENVRGYSIYGSYDRESPPADLVSAVARGDVDVAIAWGPLASWAARRSPVPLTVRALEESADSASLPLSYEIAMGVRKRDEALARELDALLVRREREIQAILRSSGVPTTQRAGRRTGSVREGP